MLKAWCRVWPELFRTSSNSERPHLVFFYSSYTSMHLHKMKSTDFLEKIGHTKNQFHVRCPSTCVLTPVTFCLKAEIMTFSLGMRLQQWVEEGKGQYQKFPDGGNSALKLFAPFNFWIGFQNYCSSNVQQSFDRYREIEVNFFLLQKIEFGSG